MRREATSPPHNNAKIATPKLLQGLQEGMTRVGVRPLCTSPKSWYAPILFHFFALILNNHNRNAIASKGDKDFDLCQVPSSPPHCGRVASLTWQLRQILYGKNCSYRVKSTTLSHRPTPRRCFLAWHPVSSMETTHVGCFVLSALFRARIFALGTVFGHKNMYVGCYRGSLSLACRQPFFDATMKFQHHS